MPNFLSVPTTSASDLDIATKGNAALITKSFADSNYVLQGGPTPSNPSSTPSIIQLTSTNTTTDINRTIDVTVPFDTLDFNSNTSLYSHSSGVVTITDAGYYWIYAHISYNDNGQTSPQRGNPSVRVYKNGSTSLNYTGAHGYLRNASAHDEASNSIACMVQLAQNDTIEIKTLALTTATNPLYLTSGESVLTICQMAGPVAPTGVSSTADSTANPSTIDLSQVAGTYYTSTSNTSSYTIDTGAVVGGFAHLTINRGTEPTFTNATKMAGATFAASTDMKMIVYNDGSTNYYYFLEI